MFSVKSVVVLVLILAIIESAFLYVVVTSTINYHDGYTELTIQTDSEATYTSGNRTWIFLYNPSWDLFQKTGLSPPPMMPNAKPPNLYLAGGGYEYETAMNAVKGETGDEQGLIIKATELNSDHIVLWVKPSS